MTTLGTKRIPAQRELFQLRYVDVELSFLVVMRGRPVYEQWCEVPERVLYAADIAFGPKMLGAILTVSGWCGAVSHSL